MYGSVEHAQVAIGELQQRRDATFRIVGLIDDNPAMAKVRLQGYPVLGSFNAFDSIITDHRVDTIILNRKPLDAERLAAIEALCRERGLSLLRLEISVKEFVAGDGPVSAPRSPE